MREIKPMWRAEFANPIGPLNPLGVKMRVRVTVEVVREACSWIVQSTQTAKPFNALGKFESASDAKTGAATGFAEQTGDWELWGIAELSTPPRLIHPEEYSIHPDGSVWLRTADDLLHITKMDGKPKSRPGVSQAECGRMIRLASLISIHAGKAPSCRECAAAYAKHLEGLEAKWKSNSQPTPSK